MTDEARLAYRWLNRNFKSEKEIRALKLRLYKLETDINNCVKPMEKSEVQNGRSGNSQEIKLAEYADLKNDIEARLRHLQSEDRKCLESIKKVETTLDRVLLIERYINRKRWSRIFKDMYISKTTAFRHHDSALDELYKYIPQADLLEMTED